MGGYPGLKRPRLNLPTHLHLVLRLRMYGALRPYRQYIFMAWRLVKRYEEINELN